MLICVRGKYCMLIFLFVKLLLWFFSSWNELWSRELLGADFCSWKFFPSNFCSWNLLHDDFFSSWNLYICFSHRETVLFKELSGYWFSLMELVVHYFLLMELVACWSCFGENGPMIFLLMKLILFMELVNGRLLFLKLVACWFLFSGILLMEVVAYWFLFSKLVVKLAHWVFFASQNWFCSWNLLRTDFCL